MLTPAEKARVTAGYTPMGVAVRIGISEGYLLAVERGQKPCSFRLATRLSRLYGCNLNLFLRKGGREKQQRAS